MSDLPPVALTCPNPTACPVVEALPRWEAATVFAGGETWHRGYDFTWGYDENNPGYGDARFSPIDAADGARIPSLYLAADQTAALLETVFHAIDASSVTTDVLGRAGFPEEQLRGWALVSVASPAPARLADLRDPALERMGLNRSQLVTSSAEHYPCTRRLATAIHADPRQVAGIIWHSRQAEINGHGQTETIVLFGDRHPMRRRRGQWEWRHPGIRSIYEGPGRDLAELIAEDLGLIIE